MLVSNQLQFLRGNFILESAVLNLIFNACVGKIANILGGGVKHSLLIPAPGEMIHVDEHIFHV